MHSNTMWFETLFGIDESKLNYPQIQSNFEIRSKHDTNSTLEYLLLCSKANNREFPIGTFSCPTLHDLQTEVSTKLSDALDDIPTITLIHDIVNDALELHAQYPGATIQAASQFNCLEFPNPEVIPEDGITWYHTDHTQGPACAIACAAGTLYRNYFTKVQQHDDNGEQQVVVGQTKNNQLNNLVYLEKEINNSDQKYWEIQNGYSFSTEDGLQRLNKLLSEHADIEQFQSLIKVGVHRNVGVLFSKRNIQLPREITPIIAVTQVYCSALSCAYSGVRNEFWEPLARIVLNASYEATLLTAVLNSIQEKSSLSEDFDQTYKSHVFLTFVGGGVFGNDQQWIIDAINRAIQKVKQIHKKFELVVHICHFRKLNSEIVDAIVYN